MTVCIFSDNLANDDPFYQAIDMFVLNSHAKGMSNTILEAMACGLPVIAMNVASNPELIVAGSSGMLVPAGDVNVLADTLAALVRRPAMRDALGLAARRRAEDEYRIDRTAYMYEGICERLPDRLIHKRRANGS